MKNSYILATISIAIYLISTGANGQNAVYRCGNSYSQKPCTDATVVDVQDARTQEQKVQSDAAIRRDTATANSIQKTRLAEEAEQRAAQTKLAAAQSKKASPPPNEAASPQNLASTTTTKRKSPKNTAKQHKPAPKHFVAIAPGSEAKPSKRTGKGKGQ